MRLNMFLCCKRSQIFACLSPYFHSQRRERVNTLNASCNRHTSVNIAISCAEKLSFHEGRAARTCEKSLEFWWQAICCCCCCGSVVSAGRVTEGTWSAQCLTTNIVHILHFHRDDREGVGWKCNPSAWFHARWQRYSQHAVGWWCLALWISLLQSSLFHSIHFHQLSMLIHACWLIL